MLKATADPQRLFVQRRESQSARKGAATGVCDRTCGCLYAAATLALAAERKEVVEIVSQSAARSREGLSKRGLQIASLILHHVFVCLAEMRVGHSLSPQLLARG